MFEVGKMYWICGEAYICRSIDRMLSFENTYEIPNEYTINTPVVAIITEY